MLFFNEPGPVSVLVAAGVDSNGNYLKNIELLIKDKNGQYASESNGRVSEFPIATVAATGGLFARKVSICPGNVRENASGTCYSLTKQVS